MSDLALALRSAWYAFNLTRHGGVKQLGASLIPTWQRTTPTTPALDYEGLVAAGYARNTLIYACITELATSAASAPLRVYQRARDGNENEIVGHPAAALVNAPNPFYTDFELVEDAITLLYIAGNAYIEKERARGGQVVGLWPLRPDRVTILPDGAGIRGYEYAIGDQKVVLPPQDVIHLKLPNPLNRYYGQSPMSTLARAGDLDNAALDWLRLFFQNAAIPAGVYKTKNRLSEIEATRIKEGWRAKFGGAGNYHDIAVIDSEGDYQRIGIDISELDVDALTSVSETRICQAFGVPPILVGAKVGLDRSTFANYAEARASLWEETLVPLYRRVQARLTQQLLVDFTPSAGEHFGFDLSGVQALQEDETARWQRATAALSAGGITINDYRALIGLKDLPDGDVLLLPTSAKTVKPDAIYQEPQPVPDALAQEGADDVDAPIEDETDAEGDADDAGDLAKEIRAARLEVKRAREALGHAG